ncbi:lipopolysaccharide biosynthesis protein [Spongisporangium articulatum]|uniref:Lipopolysaccharide biosynthesis protein n=1 Tax=Spongisporangium articulatum TaxID=3362603 RepID=A0ABW8ATD7_9ACTN
MPDEDLPDALSDGGSADAGTDQARNLGDAAARGVSVVLATQALRVALQFGSVVLLARLLTPEDFGLVAMVTAVIGIAEIIRDAGLSSAAVQAAQLSEDERTNLFWANLGLGTACALVIVASEPLIVAGYGEPRIGPIIYSLAFVFMISGANTQYRSDMMRRLKFRQLSTSELSAQFLAIVTAVSLALAGAGLWAIVAQQIVTAAATFLINVANLRWNPGLPKRGVSLRRFFRFGFGVLGTHGLAYLTKSAANVAIGAHLGPAPLGLFNRAYQLLMTPLQQIDAPMTSVALPVLSRVQDDDERFSRYLAKTQLVACYGTSVLLAVAAGVAHPLVLVLFGPDWIGVVPIFVVLAIGGIFRTLSTIAYWIFLARGRTGAQLRMDLFARPVMIALMVGGLPWGVTGVAVGHGIAFFLYWLLAFVNVQRVTGVDVRPLFVTAVRTATLVSAPCGLVAWGLASWLHVWPFFEVVAGVLGAGVYLLLAAAMLPIVRHDLVEAVRIGRRALKR